MTTQEVINALPKHIEITQDIIDTAEMHNIRKCIGAKLLQKVFPLSKRVHWGNSEGGVIVENEKSVEITTVSKTNMMDVTKPMLVTLIHLKRKS